MFGIIRYITNWVDPFFIDMRLFATGVRMSHILLYIMSLEYCMNLLFSLVLPRETLKKDLKTKHGRKANPSHTQRNFSASHRISCVLEFASLIRSPLTCASEHLSCYIYTSKQSGNNRYPQ
jgi:hypothetical protein